MNKTNTTTDETTKKPKKRKYQTKRNILIIIQVLVVMFFMGVLIAGGAALGLLASFVKGQEILTYEDMKESIYTNSLTGFAYFQDGQLIGKLPAEQDRRLVTKNEVSPFIIDALISTEDKRFYDHPGVSFKSTTRAVLQQVTGDEVQTGGSTITQQLVKNTLLEDMFHQEVSGKIKGEELKNLKIQRKLNEILLALRLERYFSKEQIIEAYLNEVYFGKGANGSNLYGIQAASVGIFGKDANDLNLAQSAYIVGIVQSPGTYTPFQEKGLARGLKRMELVLNEMKNDGVITQNQFDEALTFDIQSSLAKAEDVQSAYDTYPFLVNEALDRATEVLVEQDLKAQGFTKSDITTQEYWDRLTSKRREILRKGYKLYTTVDKDLYEAFQKYGADPANFGENKTYTINSGNEKVTIENAMQQIGAVLIDNQTGAILANLAGRDFKVEQTDHTRAPRQPGSAMKPILAYAPAIEEGVLLSPESPVDDAPIVLNYGKSNEHTPKNWNGGFQGIMTAREALRQSWNIPAIKTYLNVGIPTAIEYAEKMGISTLVESDKQAQTGVIGGLAFGTTVEEITNAFATFANGGTFVDAYMIERIENNEGEVIYQHQPKTQAVFSKQTAYLVTDMMKTVYHNGTGNRVKQRFIQGNKEYGKVDIAGKTGTTNQDHDLWFIGYTPHITLGVWTGFDQPTSQKGSQYINVAKFAWGDLMKTVFQLKPELSPIDAKFEKPDGLVSLEICSKSGKLPSDLCRQAGNVITGTFKKENVPTETDDSHVKGRVVIINEKSYLAHDDTPDDMVISKIYIKTEPLQFPTKSTKSLSEYLPKDWADRLPEETDPRIEDGQIPSIPTEISVNFDANTSHSTIRWKPNPETDIAGYRIYRIGDYGNIQHIGSKLAHEAKEFVDTGGNLYSGYYITAVDIAGKESSPSEIYTTSGFRHDWSSGQPSTPKGAKATMSGVTVELTWHDNPFGEKVEKYNIYYSLIKDGSYELLGSNAIGYYQHLTFGEEPGWYKITAVNSFGESDPTAPFTVKRNDNGNDNGNSQNDQGNNNQTETDEDPIGDIDSIIDFNFR